jgi:molybdopterin synthase catalytic subunit
MRIRVTEHPFDPGAEVTAFAGSRRDSGALANFVGYCRDETRGKPVEELFIEQYHGFTEKEIERLASDVARDQGTLDLMVVHRVGAIRPGEPIVLVAALHAHRNQAFEAVRILMDYLKTDAPLWKRETGPGGARWIEPTDHDHARRAKAGHSVEEKA